MEFSEFKVGTDRFQFEIDKMPQMRDLNQDAFGVLPVEKRVDFEVVESHTEGTVVGRVSGPNEAVDTRFFLI